MSNSRLEIKRDEFLTFIDYYEYYKFHVNLLFNRPIYRPMCTHMSMTKQDKNYESLAVLIYSFVFSLAELKLFTLWTDNHSRENGGRDSLSPTRIRILFKSN